MVDDETPPKGFNRVFEYVKHIGNDTLKGAIKGALVGGAIAGGVAMLMGGAVVAAIPVVGPFLAPMGAGMGLTAASSFGYLASGALLGGKLGGLIGGGFSALDANEAVDAKEDRARERALKSELRQQQHALLEQRVAMQQMALQAPVESRGMKPNVSFGKEMDGPQLT